jgi:hypothetical protein
MCRNSPIKVDTVIGLNSSSNLNRVIHVTYWNGHKMEQEMSRCIFSQTNEVGRASDAIYHLQGATLAVRLKSFSHHTTKDSCLWYYR